jgi:cytochrome b561
MTDQSKIAHVRYTPVAQALHWITALLVFLTIPLAWVMVNMPSTAHIAGQLFTLHESIGITILMIVAARLIWRARHPAPPLPQGFARWDRLAARASHWLLYAVLIGMPVSGYLMNSTGGYPVGFYWLFNLPGWVPASCRCWSMVDLRVGHPPYHRHRVACCRKERRHLGAHAA